MMPENQFNERYTALVVCSDRSDREYFKDILSDEFDVVAAESYTESLSLIEFDDHVSVVVISADDDEGMGFLKKLNDTSFVSKIPVIAVASEKTLYDVSRIIGLGVDDFVWKHNPAVLIKKRLLNIILLYEKKASETEKFLDPLTGAFNMDGFRNESRRLIKAHPENEYSMTYVDIRGFKFINDFFGVEKANSLIKEWVRLVKDNLKEDEVIGRVGADEIVTLIHMDEERLKSNVFFKISDSLSTFFNSGEKPYTIEFAAGTYLILPSDRINPDIDRIIGHSIIAHDKAKKKYGSVHEVLNNDEWNNQWRSMKISQSLTEAIENGDISVWLQPQYNFSEKRIVSAEALCRWKHRELGDISPGEFIPLLESTGQIAELDKYVWEQVCVFLSEWKSSGISSDITISVNISRADIKASFAPDEVIASFVEKYNLSPDMIHVEITESACIDDTKNIIDLVRKFQDKKFTVEMDDFGSGYSSLNSLKDIEVDVLKLDMGFLYNSEQNQRSGRILDGVVQLAKNLEMELVAEGIENVTQANFLSRLGCNIMQGYYFSKPVPVSRFKQLVEDSLKTLEEEKES